MNKRIIKSNDEAAGNASFNTVLYTGNSSTKNITGVGFQPDMVWMKLRNLGAEHILSDSVRGVNKELSPNNTYFEEPRGVVSFDSDGFSLNSNYNYNDSTGNYVAWCWKAGGAAVANTDGTITSQVSANVDAGFSIITTTTNASGYLNCGHGLGVKPDVVLIKSRDNASTWYMYHKGTSGTPENDAMQLNNTSAVWDAGTYGAGKWSLNNTVIASGTAQWYYQLNSSFVIYAFAEVAGFSKFGSYTGNGSTTGEIIDCGFEPAFVMIKASSLSASWVMLDNKRSTSNPRDNRLLADTSSAEDSGTPVNFLINGFQSTSTSGGSNTLNATYIYMAFANQF